SRAATPGSPSASHTRTAGSQAAITSRATASATARPIIGNALSGNEAKETPSLNFAWPRASGNETQETPSPSPVRFAAMSPELANPELIPPTPRKRPLGFELVFVVLVSLAVMVPGIWSYSLVDPWETHYGEVARMMLQNHDWVHTEWPQD